MLACVPIIHTVTSMQQVFAVLTAHAVSTELAAYRGFHKAEQLHLKLRSLTA